MRRDNICAKYTTATIMYASSSDKSDSDTDSNALEVVEKNHINNNDNFSIGIHNDDDDDDDNSSESKRRQISELYNYSKILEDGSFPISKENLVGIMTLVALPPRINFQSFPFMFTKSPVDSSLYMLWGYSYDQWNDKSKSKQQFFSV